MTKERELLRRVLFVRNTHDLSKLFKDIEEVLANTKTEAVHGVVLRNGSPTFVADRFRKDTDVLLYTSPPKRDPLSADEILKIRGDGHMFSAIDFARAIERAHGIGK
jgi:hypothetical protein